MSIISHALFAKLRNNMERYDQLRENVITLARNARIASKKAIYALHKNENARSAALLKEAKDSIAKIHALIKKEPHLASVGAYTEALEEYVEAACYDAVLKNKDIPTPEQLGVDADTYLPGLCDLVGELVRRAVNSAARNEAKHALWLKDIVVELYEELSLFEPRNIPLRRKLDSIKYSVERLENLALELKRRA